MINLDVKEETMGIFSKLKNGKLKEHPTIGEQKKYYEKRSKDKTLSNRQQNYANKRLQELNKLTEQKTAVSKNFVGRDGDVTGNKNAPDKVRYGVCSKVKGDKINFHPFLPRRDSEVNNEFQVEVKAQHQAKGREHAVRVRPSQVNINQVCEDKGFPEKDTRIMTPEEFKKLKKLSKGNKKKRKD